MTVLIILFLIFLGIVLLLLEFAVVPGITIAGIGGVLLLGASIYLAFNTYGIIAGIITAAFVLIASPLLVLRFFRSRTGKKMVLESEISGRVDQIDENDIHPGDEGITVGRLAPTGKVRINNHTMEGKAITGFIDQQVAIRVVEVLKTQVIVEPIN
ncbi:NfeD family protein [Mangrovibacterium diazotrophicum]|uniref:NfeD-like partner-binding protein n=1 Tax=Mangrovibacterium diazotrophicum TaxID=1261403 RepID=A0A419W5R7_9BACT|nr:hypothetical protein [Mangrovibacterium diazotrophicum]RKD90792.1 hypothetical protein BC643_1135 [Mangrovibacterium diazotrophicum]